MISSILEKLNKELAHGIHSEPKVVYLLIEIRKYLDSINLKPSSKYATLYFYCNWVAHVRMDRASAKKILERFDTYFNKEENLKTIAAKFISQESHFYTLITLKKELAKFIEVNSLPKRILDNTDWKTFQSLLIEVLKDCPLINDCGKIYKFSFIEGSDKQIRFRVHVRKKGSFKITLKDVTRKLLNSIS